MSATQKNYVGNCSIKNFNFADISKFFRNIMKVIYADIQSETITVSTPFYKLSNNIAQV